MSPRELDSFERQAKNWIGEHIFDGGSYTAKAMATLIAIAYKDGWVAGREYLRESTASGSDVSEGATK